MDTAARGPTDEAIGLVVRFTIKEGREREFDDLVASTVTAIEQHEPGTLLYITHTVEQAPQARIFYELYRDRAAFQAHEDQPHVQHFLTERERLVDRVDVDWLIPASHAGISREAES